MPARRPVVIVSLAAAAIGATLPGCEESNEAALSLSKAEATIAALHEGPSLPPVEHQTESYANIRRTLAPALASEKEASQAAAKLIVGQTLAGDAEAAARRAEEIDAEAGRLLAHARTLANRLYVWRHARADAAASYRPAARLAEIDEQIAEAQERRAELTTERQRLEDRLAELQAAARSAAEEARELRGREVDRRDQALSLEGEARAEAMRQVFEAQRAADASVRRAADFEARIAVAGPELEEVEIAIEGVQREIELLRSSRESLLEREARSARTAQVDREQASIAATDLEAILSELHQLRTGELDGAFVEAAQSYDRSIGDLRSAVRAGASPLWLAAAEHGLAQVHSVRAISAGRYADVLEGLSELEPRLPFAGELASRAKAAREEADRSIAEAREAYEAAASSYQRGARGQEADKLRGIAETLEARAAGERMQPDDSDDQDAGGAERGMGDEADENAEGEPQD